MQERFLKPYFHLNVQRKRIIGEKWLNKLLSGHFQLKMKEDTIYSKL